jgi:hypothetical protein
MLNDRIFTIYANQQYTSETKKILIYYSPHIAENPRTMIYVLAVTFLEFLWPHARWHCDSAPPGFDTESTETL